MTTAEPRKSKLPLEKMRELVLQEMDHIPRWPKEQQSYLRAEYWFWRMNSLGKKAEVPNDRTTVLRKCLESLARSHPDAEFQYDRDFFGDLVVEESST